MTAPGTTTNTRRLRELIASGEFLYMPSCATPLEGRLAEAAGTPLVYTAAMSVVPRVSSPSRC